MSRKIISNISKANENNNSAQLSNKRKKKMSKLVSKSNSSPLATAVGPVDVCTYKENQQNHAPSYIIPKKSAFTASSGPSTDTIRLKSYDQYDEDECVDYNDVDFCEYPVQETNQNIRDSQIPKYNDSDSDGDITAVEQQVIDE